MEHLPFSHSLKKNLHSGVSAEVKTAGARINFHCAVEREGDINSSLTFPPSY